MNDLDSQEKSSPDEAAPQAPTGDPQFERASVVGYEDRGSVPEGEIFARIIKVDVLEFAYYFEPDFQQEKTYFNLDPYTGFDKNKDEFYLTLRMALRCEPNKEDEDQPLELGEITIQFTFEILNIENLVGDNESINISGSVFAEMLRTVYDGARTAWAVKAAETPYSDILLPHANMEALMKDFFGYTIEEAEVSEDTSNEKEGPVNHSEEDQSGIES